MHTHPRLLGIGQPPPPPPPPPTTPPEPPPPHASVLWMLSEDLDPGADTAAVTNSDTWRFSPLPPALVIAGMGAAALFLMTRRK